MIFYYTSGGALVCDEAIAGITSDMSDDPWERWYGHRQFIAESMSKECARRMAHALGGLLMEYNVPPSRQIVGATTDIRRELSWQAMYGSHSRG